MNSSVASALLPVTRRPNMIRRTRHSAEHTDWIMTSAELSGFLSFPAVDARIISLQQHVCASHSVHVLRYHPYSCRAGRNN